MTRLAAAIIAMATRLLPQQERRRYAEELDTDMRSLPRSRRVTYAVSVLLAAPRLRWHLLTRLAEGPAPACFFGLHDDRTTHPNPESHIVISRECRRCHRITDPRQYEPRRRVNDLRAWYSAGSSRT
ncbi:hypothetical protein BCF74_101261 [Knoellia remsis]|uniref:Uncharacterized protein n=1 Tax=Knoellia remsis TaxID=407159 RepID=A0A2T0V119_9MICO|nr:hypothetical protein [Knoellia remsis]PRY63854.1 hypothetical protein BCF74_101261 [Knoellia remsis]